MAKPGWYWTVMVGGQAMASFSVDKMGKKPAKKAAKEYGKVYINMRGPGFPQLKLTLGLPIGSQDLTPPDSLLALGRDTKAVEKALRGQYRSLTAELKDEPGADGLGGAYIDKLLALSIEVSQVADKAGSPPMTTEAWMTVEYWTKRMIRYWDLPAVDLAIGQAYIGANAETWTELSRAEFDRLAQIGVEAAREEGDGEGPVEAAREEGDGEGPAAGFEILAGFMLRFTHPGENRIPAFDPFRDYVIGQPSYQRLDECRSLLLTLSRFDLPEMTDEEMDIYKDSHEIAWNMGLMTLILDRNGHLDNPGAA